MLSSCVRQLTRPSADAFLIASCSLDNESRLGSDVASSDGSPTSFILLRNI